MSDGGGLFTHAMLGIKEIVMRCLLRLREMAIFLMTPTYKFDPVHVLIPPLTERLDSCQR